MKRKELTMTEKMFNDLKEEKEITGETVNSIVRAAVNEYLKKKERERRK